MNIPFDKIEMGKLIPKFIYMTHSQKELPYALKENVNNVIKINPGWNYLLFDDQERNNYILSKSSFLHECYNKIDIKYGPARADFFRYIILYYEGGCYLDIKSSTAIPLSQIIKPEDKYILSYWDNIDFPLWGKQHKELINPLGEFQQWHIIAVKGHPFLAAVIDAVTKKINTYNPYFHGVGKKGVVNVTGPVIYSNTIYPLIQKYPCTIYESEKSIGLIYSVFNHNHHLQFKQHYSTLLYPIITNGKTKTIFVIIFQNIKYSIIYYINLIIKTTNRYKSRLKRILFIIKDQFNEKICLKP